MAVLLSSSLPGEVARDRNGSVLGLGCPVSRCSDLRERRLTGVVCALNLHIAEI
jgi:hypothetical protein